MVTGVTGYVAGWLVKRLLENGLTVHAPVRNPENPEKLKHLDDLAENSQGIIRYFKADLLDNGSYAEAMAGCSVVFQILTFIGINRVKIFPANAKKLLHSRTGGVGERKQPMGNLGGA